jgi:hypothetical protein
MTHSLMRVGKAQSGRAAALAAALQADAVDFIGDRTNKV